MNCEINPRARTNRYAKYIFIYSNKLIEIINLIIKSQIGVDKICGILTKYFVTYPCEQNVFSFFFLKRAPSYVSHTFTI